MSARADENCRSLYSHRQLKSVVAAPSRLWISDGYEGSSVDTNPAREKCQSDVGGILMGKIAQLEGRLEMPILDEKVRRGLTWRSLAEIQWSNGLHVS